MASRWARDAGREGSPPSCWPQAGAFLASGQAQAAPDAASTLIVHADQPFRPVTHVATGSLYGLATDTVPSQDVVSAIKPNTFVQMAPGGHQLPNGEPAPAGDALVVSPSAARAGAKVVVRMPDWYPNFPYRWVSWDDWLAAVDTQVKSVLASGAQNIAAYELWNEPDWTWDTAHAGSFNDGWVRTYREVRSLDATTPIQGPSYSDNISDMQSFLTNAVATNTVPDIIAWHELESSSHIAGDIAKVEAIEDSLGISRRPIDIEEYADPAEVGIPGRSSATSRSSSATACTTPSSRSGTTPARSATSSPTPAAAPNGAYWLYKWYADMSGNMVTTTPPRRTALRRGRRRDVRQEARWTSSPAAPPARPAIRVAGLDKLALGDARQRQARVHAVLRAHRADAGADHHLEHDLPGRRRRLHHRPGRHEPGLRLPRRRHAGRAPRPSLAGTYTITNVNSGLALDTRRRHESGIAPEHTG